MQAVVKTPHIEITIKGEIPKKLITTLKEEFGKKVHFINDTDDEYVNVFDTDWYKKIKAEKKPGDNMKIYRKIHKMTQDKLGELLGGIPRQHISNMEHNIRPISKNNAKKLAKLFDVNVERFI
jgi:DNA-binding XRE family transcriptional regulator